MSDPETSAPDVAETLRLLRVFLQDHHAGSSFGVSMIQRCRKANRGTEFDDGLAGIEREVVEDRQSLETIMTRFAVRPNPVKTAVGSVTETVGRLKTNGRLFRYSPLSRLVELETIAGGVSTKLNLWRALGAVADRYDELDATDLGRLRDRATAQLERLTGLHASAASIAFGAPPG